MNLISQQNIEENNSSGTFCAQCGRGDPTEFQTIKFTDIFTLGGNLCKDCNCKEPQQQQNVIRYGPEEVQEFNGGGQHVQNVGVAVAATATTTPTFSQFQPPTFLEDLNSNHRMDDKVVGMAATLQQQQPTINGRHLSVNGHGLSVIASTSTSSMTCAAEAATASAASTSTPTEETMPRIPCTLCKKTFKNDKMAKAHLQRVHEKVNRFVCEICGAVFSYRGSLDSHLASHPNHPITTHDCPKCGQKFKEKSNLYHHLRHHSEENPKKFLCPQCPSGFSKRVNLRYHVRRKHPEVDVDKATMNNNNGSSISGDSKTPGSASTSGQTANGSFICDQCGRSFLFKNNLKAHLKTHSREKQYTCDQCQKSFIYKESLKNHMLLHSNELPYQCEVCGKKFRDRSNRRKHVKNVHKYLAAPQTAEGESSSSSHSPSPNKSRRKRSQDAETGTAQPQQLPEQSQLQIQPPDGSNGGGRIIKRVWKRTKKSVSSTVTHPIDALSTSTDNVPDLGVPVPSLLTAAPSDPSPSMGNKSVIVSSMSGVDIGGGRKVIMSPGPQRIGAAAASASIPYQSLDYPFQSQQPQQQQQQFPPDPTVIVKGSSTISQQQYHPHMQQNVIVYPKRMHEEYEVVGSGILQQSYSHYASPPQPQHYDNNYQLHQHLISSTSQIEDMKVQVQQQQQQQYSFYQHQDPSAPYGQEGSRVQTQWDSSGTNYIEPGADGTTDMTTIYSSPAPPPHQFPPQEQEQTGAAGNAFLYRDLSQFDFSYL